MTRRPDRDRRPRATEAIPVQSQDGSTGLVYTQPYLVRCAEPAWSGRADDERPNRDRRRATPATF